MTLALKHVEVAHKSITAITKLPCSYFSQTVGQEATEWRMWTTGRRAQNTCSLGRSDVIVTAANTRESRRVTMWQQITGHT